MSFCWSLSNWAARVFSIKKEPAVSLPSDEEILKEAKDELLYAYNILDNIEQSDMMDWAIFNLRAAEEKYNFILRRVKRNMGNHSSRAEDI